MAFHVDDYEIRWQNYRPFKDTDWIVLRPLTILLGNNNSGKTSVVSPLLLMAQTMSSRDALTPLVTRGPLIDGGTFKDIFHNHDTSQSLFFGLRYHLHDKGRREIKPVGEYPPGAVEITLAVGDNTDDISLTDLAFYDIYKRPYLFHRRNPDGNYDVDFRIEQELQSGERNAISRSRPVNFLFSPTSVLGNYETPTSSTEETPSRSHSTAFNHYLRVVAFAFEQIRDLCRNLAYIGPLREQPRRYYETSGETPLSVGAHGEHMANVIRRRLANNPKELNRWIRRFEFGEKLRIDKLSDGLFSLCFVGGKHSFNTNIADAGFGASQVLPLIVQALTGVKENLTIAEQPEIHLNPRLQSMLADLFVEMVHNDQRVIVETHSEHLLLRLRRLIADGTIDSKMVAIYFVEREDNASSVKPIEIRKNGHIEQWPKGFFEDSLRETLALASAQSRLK
jgi:hypothetical protein